MYRSLFVGTETGKSVDDIASELMDLGYKVEIRKSNRKGSGAKMIVVLNTGQKEGRNITQVQVSPHGYQPYVKVSNKCGRHY